MQSLENLIHAVREGAPVHKLGDGREIMLVPNGMSVKTVSEFRPQPPRIIAERTFHDGDSLSRYALRYKNDSSLLVADIDASTISVLIDYHDGETPSTVEHVARWPVRYSEEFRAWKAFSGKLHDQSSFIAFLEENVMDVLDPEPAKLLDLAKDFSANKSVQFKSAKRLDNGDRKLTYVETTGTTGGIEIPQKIKLHMPIYFREEPVEFSAWFRYRISEGELKLGLDLHRMEPVLSAAFGAAVTRVAEASGLDPFFGSV